MHTPVNRQSLEELDFRMQVLLPEQYQESSSAVSPAPMGSSAGLKFDAAGHVQWGEMWQTFCDLAMAGGPPHKGSLLEHGRPPDTPDERERYDRVAEEICRGVALTTEMLATPLSSGWVRVDCFSETMAAWLLRAIVMENVAVRRDGRAIHLPAASHFRLEREIKNVVTVIAKTCHYWMGHVSNARKRAVADLFVSLDACLPLLEPEPVADGVVPDSHVALAARIADDVQRTTGWSTTGVPNAGWLGIECSRVDAAVWMMRALVASNVLARREGTRLFVPINPSTDSLARRVSDAIEFVHGAMHAVRSPHPSPSPLEK